MTYIIIRTSGEVEFCPGRITLQGIQNIVEPRDGCSVDDFCLDELRRGKRATMYYGYPPYTKNPSNPIACRVTGGFDPRGDVVIVGYGCRENGLFPTVSSEYQDLVVARIGVEHDG